MTATKLHAEESKISAKSQKKASFSNKKVLADKLKKQKAVARSLLASKSKKATSIRKVEPLRKDLQNEVANNLYSSYQQSQSNASSTAYLMWGIGLVLPTAFEAASVAGGLTVPNIPIFLATNLLFAAAFRFTVGNEVIHDHKHSEKSMTHEAVTLLKSDKITSDHAESTLAKMVPSQEAFNLLNGNIKSERAQLLLIDKFGSTLTPEKLRELSKNTQLSSMAKARIDSLLRKKNSKN